MNKLRKCPTCQAQGNTSSSCVVPIWDGITFNCIDVSLMGNPIKLKIRFCDKCHRNKDGGCKCGL